MDILDKLVELAQITGNVDIQCLFQGEWYVRHEAKRNQGLIHVVTHGSGYLKIDGLSEPVLLQCGDVVFFPRTAAHVLSNEAGCTNSHAAVSITQNGVFTRKQSGMADEPDLKLFCARFEYDSQADLMNSLPESVILNIRHPSLQCVIKMLQMEAERAFQGSKSVVNALSSVLLVLLVRTYLEQDSQIKLSGLLNGWRDRRLNHLVSAIIQQPEADWQVEKMSAAANISRAQLMRLFKQQMDISPHAFVNRVRLQKAAVMLKRTADSVLSIALSVGFQSETHFGKAFKKQYSVSPGQYRKADAV